MHKNTKILLNYLGPLKEEGCVRWVRNNPPYVKDDEVKSIQASLSWHGSTIVAKVEFVYKNESKSTDVEIVWQVQSKDEPTLIRFVDKGQEKKLCTRSAINRFSGQIFTLNVAPRITFN